MSAREKIRVGSRDASSCLLAALIAILINYLHKEGLL